MKHKIVEQAVRWLEKMGIEVEHNEELQQFEFEYNGAFVIIDANPPTPRDVFSIACPYIFPDETSSENKAIFEKAKQWWAEHTDADYCFCEMVDNDCAVVWCLYARYRKGVLRKYELLKMLDEVVYQWNLFMIAISSSFNNQLNIKC